MERKGTKIKVHNWLNDTSSSGQQFLSPVRDFRVDELSNTSSVSTSSVDSSICCGNNNDKKVGIPVNHDNNCNPRTKRSVSTVSAVSISIQGYRIEKVKWNKTNSDLLVKVGDRLFPVHRSVLSSNSSIIKSMLAQDEHELVLDMHEDLSDVRTMLEYMYNLGLHVDDSNVNRLLCLSQQLNFKPMINQCEQYLQTVAPPPLSLKKRGSKTWKRIVDLFEKKN